MRIKDEAQGMLWPMRILELKEVRLIDVAGIHPHAIYVEPTSSSPKPEMERGWRIRCGLDHLGGVVTVLTSESGGIHLE
jgi:hypothetical protein